MKNFLDFIGAFSIFDLSLGQKVSKVSDLVEWVNPLAGIESKPGLSNENTYTLIPTLINTHLSPINFSVIFISIP